jgi:methionyl-tRNA synthetase
LTKIRPESFDSIFDWEHFAKSHNNELKNSIGNLCNRILASFYKLYQGKIPKISAEDLG